MTSYCHLEHSLIGKLLLIAHPAKLLGIYFVDWKQAPIIQDDWKLDPQQPVLKAAAREIAEYLEGKRVEFSIPLHFAGTRFQRKIWEQLRAIPYGETISYSELARRAGNPKAVRAAGSANGRNPFCLVVPCHRVIAKNGTIGGYAGGLTRKGHLLGVENRLNAAASLPANGRSLPI